MKKLFALSILIGLIFLSISVETRASIDFSPGWTVLGPNYAENVGFSIDSNVWIEEGFYTKYITDPTSSEDDRDYGNVRIYVGVYRSAKSEYFITPFGTPHFFDNYMVVYKVITYAKTDNNEQGFIEYVEARSDVDAQHYWDNVILQYGPQSEIEGTTYTIGTSLGATPSGPSMSMSMSQSITLYDRWIDSNDTNDPIFDVEYQYDKSKTNNYASSQREHYGFFIVESASMSYNFHIKFTAYFSDHDYELFQDYQHSKFVETFEFYK